MANAEIRAMLKDSKIPYWRVADKLGVHENSVMRKLRHELPESDKALFMEAIAEIKSEQQA